MNKNIKPKFGPKRAGDVYRTSADISKIKSMLGYQPKVGFEEGLRRTVAWFEASQLVIARSKATKQSLKIK